MDHKGLKRSRCKVIEHDSSSSVVAGIPAIIRRAFDDIPRYHPARREPRRNLALIRLKNSADRCKRGPRRSQPLLLFLHLPFFVPLSPWNFGQPATIVSRDKRTPPPPQKEFHRILITNRIVRDTDSLINPMMNLSAATPGNGRHCRPCWIESSCVGCTMKEKLEEIDWRMGKDLEIWKLCFMDVVGVVWFEYNWYNWIVCR